MYEIRDHHVKFNKPDSDDYHGFLLYTDTTLEKKTRHEVERVIFGEKEITNEGRRRKTESNQRFDYDKGTHT